MDTIQRTPGDRHKITHDEHRDQDDPADEDDNDQETTKRSPRQ